LQQIDISLVSKSAFLYNIIHSDSVNLVMKRVANAGSK